MKKQLAMIAMAAAVFSTSVLAADKYPNGEAVYNKYCMACHMIGLQFGAQKAPKVHVVSEWKAKEKAAGGFDKMLKNALNGLLPGMPKHGNCLDCTEGDITNAIKFMMSAPKVKKK